MTIEYAWFLAETRGVGFALHYLDSRGVARDHVTRAVERPQLRRMHERRAAAAPNRNAVAQRCRMRDGWRDWLRD